MATNEMDSHVKEIAKALGNRVPEQEIARELENYVSVYRVSVDTAKRSIVKKHGGDPAGLLKAAGKTVQELRAGDNAVSLLARVVYVDRRTVNVPDGAKEILSGILGDNSGTVPFTAWEASGLELAKGDVVRIANAYTKEYRGRVEVHLGARAVITREPPEALPFQARAPATGGAPVPATVSEIREGVGLVTLTARVLQVEPKGVTVDGATKTVHHGLLADATGRVQFTAWKDYGLAAGDALRIEGGLVKTFRGLPQVSFDERARVERLAESDLPGMEQLSQSPRAWIEDLAERGGAVDVTLRGIVVDVKEGSGLIHRCPECKRVLVKDSCRLHGVVKGVPDLRVKAVLDDGSGALSAIFDRELTEALLQKTLEQCLEQAREAMSVEVIRDAVTDALVAQPIEVRGNVTSDEYGLMLMVQEARVLRVDVQEEARAMLGELEESS